MEKFPLYLDGKTSEAHEQNIGATLLEAAALRCPSK